MVKTPTDNKVSSEVNSISSQTSPKKKRVTESSQVRNLYQIQNSDRGWKLRFGELIGQAKIILSYIKNDIKKQSRSFKIGLCSVVLVVTFLTILATLIQQTPIIFLRLSENEVGDMDILVSPIASVNNTNLATQQGTGNNANTTNTNTNTNTNITYFINNINNFIRLVDQQAVQNNITNISEIAGTAPRWYLLGDAQNFQDTNLSSRVYLILLNSTQELNIGFGRNNELLPLNPGEGYITDSALRLAGYQIEDDEAAEKLSGISIYYYMNLLRTIFSVNLVSFGQGVNTTIFTQSNSTELENLVTELLLQQFQAQQNTTLNSDQALDALETTKVQLQQQNQSEITTDDFIRISNDSGLPQVVQTAILQQVPNNNNTIRVDDVVTQIDQLQQIIPAGLSATIDIESIIRSFVPFLLAPLEFTTEVRIKKVLTGSKGKWPKSLGNVLIMEGDSFMQSFSEGLINNFRISINNFIESQQTEAQRQLVRGIWGGFNASFEAGLIGILTQFNISRNTMTSNIVFKNKEIVYTDSTNTDRLMVQISNKIADNMGRNIPYSLDAPLSLAYKGLSIINAFLNNIFVAILALLILLSCILIYSLMLTNVNEKTYEYGMLRSLGYNQQNLINLLTANALFFAIPGLTLGMVICYIINSITSWFVFMFTGIYTSYNLHGIAVAIGMLIGILLPLISNILPIQRALSKTLRDSLDVFNRSLNSITIKFIRLEQAGIDPPSIVSGLMLVIIGFVTYYLAPLSFVFQELELFLYILNGILLVMIVGFALILNLVQRPFELLVLRILVLIMRKDRKLEPIIQKNMQAHQKRNSQTAIMFSIAMAFLLFAGTGLRLQGSVLTNQIKLSLGSDLQLQTFGSDTFGLRENELRGFMKKFSERYPGMIRDYSFITVEMDKIPGAEKILLSPLCQFPQAVTRLIGVERNYLNSIYDEFYLPGEYDPTVTVYEQLQNSGKQNGIYGLYTDEGLQSYGGDMDSKNVTTRAYSREKVKSALEQLDEIKIVIAEGLRYGLSLDTDVPSLLTVQNKNSTFRARVRHLIGKVPGITFSQYQQVQFFSRTLVSMKQYKFMLDYIWSQAGNNQTTIEEYKQQLPSGNTYEIPKAKLFIQYNRETTLIERAQLINGIKNYINLDTTIVYDTLQLVLDMEEALLFLELFLVVIAAIALFLTFFLLLVSFVNNIKENAWEFGVLRAIGLTNNKMFKLYIYEAFSLTLSSGILGCIIGIGIALLIASQFALFIELPLQFNPPWIIIVATFILGVIISIVAPYNAMATIKKKTVSSIIKGL